MCGIDGMFAPSENVVSFLPFGLVALQHRGQEGAGLSWSDGEYIITYKDFGLVREVLNARRLQGQEGFIGIGQVRYSTTGRHENWQNLQPISSGYSTIAHNGNLVNSEQLRKILIKKGVEFNSTTDTEIIANQIHRLGRNIRERIIEGMNKYFIGAYSVLTLTRTKLIAFRDPWGFRPLSIGQTSEGYYVIASETCALDKMKARFWRDVMPGEMIVINEDGFEGKIVTPPRKPSFCIFEAVYFSRPDSLLMNGSLEVGEMRKRAGRFLAQNDDIEADAVIGVPDSGIYYALGYQEASGIKYDELVVKDPFSIRIFIQPEERGKESKLKWNPRVSVSGKRLVVVDDSIVRGINSKQFINQLWERGAKEVHYRVGSAPIRYPCFYGIDTANRKELIAANLSIKEIEKYLKVTTLKYLPFEEMVASTGHKADEFCLACFDGHYPTPVPKERNKHLFD